MFLVFKVNITRYLPSAIACPYDDGVFLSAGELLLFGRIRDTTLTDQPLPCRGVDQGHVDEAPMLPAELLKGSVRNKRIDQPQLSI